MRKLITAIISAAVAAALCACSLPGSDSVQKPQAAAETAQPEEQVQAVADVSNTITIGIDNTDTWNPLMTQSSTMREALDLMYEPLFEINPAHEAVPVLASEYKVSPDGLTVEVYMRDGVLWHDGSALDAYDAAYTVKHILSGVTQYTDQLSDVADYRAISDDCIRFVLKKSVPDFVSMLTFPIVKYQSSLNGGKPVGTGPFSYYGKISTDEYMLLAFDGYHNGRPAIDAVTITIVPGGERYRFMFEASEVDLITDTSVDVTEKMPKGNINTYSYVSDKMTYVGFNLESSVAAGAATRRGISRLIDRDEIVSSLLYSRAVSVSVPINPSSYLYYDTAQRFVTEYEGAYAEFEKDGWKSDGAGFERRVNNKDETLRMRLLVNSDNAQQLKIAEHLRGVLDRYGVAVTLDKQDSAGYEAKLNSRSFDMFIGEEHLRANNDLSPMTGDGNSFAYRSDEVSALLAQAGMNTDAEYRKQIFIQIGEKLREDAPFVPLYFAKSSVMTGTKIKSGVEPSVSSDYRVANIWRVK